MVVDNCLLILLLAWLYVAVTAPPVYHRPPSNVPNTATIILFWHATSRREPRGKHAAPSLSYCRGNVVQPVLRRFWCDAKRLVLAALLQVAGGRAPLQYSAIQYSTSTRGAGRV